MSSIVGPVALDGRGSARGPSPVITCATPMLHDVLGASDRAWIGVKQGISLVETIGRGFRRASDFAESPTHGRGVTVGDAVVGVGRGPPAGQSGTAKRGPSDPIPVWRTVEEQQWQPPA